MPGETTVQGKEGNSRQTVKKENVTRPSKGGKEGRVLAKMNELRQCDTPTKPYTRNTQRWACARHGRAELCNWVVVKLRLKEKSSISPS